MKCGPYWFDSLEVNAMSVQVVGSKGEGEWVFPNLVAAQNVFPDLDPHRDTTRFTAAMRGEVDGIPALRFETWTGYEIYAS